MPYNSFIKEENYSCKSNCNSTFALNGVNLNFAENSYTFSYERVLFLSYYFYTDSTKPHSHLIVNLFLIEQTIQELSLMLTDFNISANKHNLNYSQDLTLDYLRNIYSEDGAP